MTLKLKIRQFLGLVIHANALKKIVICCIIAPIKCLEGVFVGYCL